MYEDCIITYPSQLVHGCTSSDMSFFSPQGSCQLGVQGSPALTLPFPIYMATDVATRQPRITIPSDTFMMTLVQCYEDYPIKLLFYFFSHQMTE